MGLFSSLLDLGTKIIISPFAVVEDVGKGLSGDKPGTTKNLVKSALKDVEDIVDDVLP